MRNATAEMRSGVKEMCNATAEMRSGAAEMRNSAAERADISDPACALWLISPVVPYYIGTPLAMTCVYTWT